MPVNTRSRSHGINLLAFGVAMIFAVPACTAQEKALPVSGGECTEASETTAFSTVLLNVDRKGNVIGRELESGLTRTITDLGSSLHAYLPVASPSGKWLCIRSTFEPAGGPDYAMLVILERSGDGWRTRWTTDVGDWRGIPVFVGGERYLVIGRFRRDHLGWRNTEREEREAEERRDKRRAEAYVFDLVSGKRMDSAVSPLYAGDTDVIGCAIGDSRALLTQWVSDTESNIVEYDVGTWRSRLVRPGSSPLKVDSETFVFAQGNAVCVAPFADPDKSVRIVEGGTVKAVVPCQHYVLVEIWERDPAYLNKDFPSLWKVDVRSGARKRVLDHTIYFAGADPGWVSFLNSRASR